MLKIKKLRFKGIGRFVEEQLIDFEKLGNFVQIDGQNNNTGGSSGAGKSTIFNALDYLLGLNDVPNSVLKSRMTEDGIWVQGEFDYDGKNLVITRGKKLSIDVDGEIVTGSSKISEEKLDQILSIPRNLFRQMLHKRQKEGGFFLKLTPKEINDYLMDCLNLSHFRQKLEKIDAAIASIGFDRQQCADSLIAARSALDANQNAILALGLAPVKEIHQSVIVDLKAKFDKSSVDYQAIAAKHKTENDDLEKSRPQIQSTSYDRTQIQAVEKDIAEFNKRISDLQTEELNRQRKVSEELSEMRLSKVRLEAKIRSGKEAAEESAKLAQEIKKIRESICPTCEQSWANEQSRAREEALLGRLKSLKEIITDSNEAAQNIGAVNFTIEELARDSKPKEIAGLEYLKEQISIHTSILNEEKKEEKDHQIKELEKNKSIQNAFAEQQKALRERQSQELSQVQGQLDIDRRAFDLAVSKLRAYEEARVRYETSLASLQAQESTYKAKLGNLQKELTDIENRFSIAEELKKAVKSYLSCSFENALQTIGENATKIIRNIPNMANATIQLEGTRETKDGKVKEEVNAVIHMDGEENVDIRSLCGGERTATDLAIDLSVIDLIENEANKGIDLFSLDEPFDGLDTVCIEMALEVLKNSNTNKRLILVDHNPEVKQMVESRLVVVREGSTSNVQQVA